MRGRLSGRSAVITGGADGIGRGMAVRFAVEGAAVLVADFNDEKGRESVEAIRRGGGRAEFLRCDVTLRDDMLAAVSACVDHFGAVDILVNNAYRGSGLGRIESKFDTIFEDGLALYLYAAKWSMEAAFPLAMRAPHIDNVILIAKIAVCDLAWGLMWQLTMRRTVFGVLWTMRRMVHARIYPVRRTVRS